MICIPRYNSDMILRIAQGDAYCIATEFIKPSHRKTYEEALCFNKYISNPVYKTKPGYYTDDTQMSIAISEVILYGNVFNRLDYAEAIVRCFKRDERKAYAKGFQKFLESVNSGQEFLDKINPDSDNNGAAIRAVPLGILSNPDNILEAAEVQAKITHNTPDAILAAQAVALMSHFALYSPFDLEEPQLGSYLYSYLPEFINRYNNNQGRITPPNLGIKTAQAAFYTLTRYDNLLDMLRSIIEVGGDTDSVAAIVMGVASTRMVEELPPFLENDLEPNSKFGVAFLKELGKKLMDKYSND